MNNALPPYLRKAFLLVFQTPSTFHESASLLAQLAKNYGPVVHFLRIAPQESHIAKARARATDSSGNEPAIYEILFNVKHPSKFAENTLNKSFTVTLPASDPSSEDPFNIRGLQDRMPFQIRQTTFECRLSDNMPSNTIQPPANQEWPGAARRRDGSFRSLRHGPFFDALQDAQAPPGLTRNLVAKPVERSDLVKKATERKLQRHRSVVQPDKISAGLEQADPDP